MREHVITAQGNLRKPVESDDVSSLLLDPDRDFSVRPVENLPQDVITINVPLFKKLRDIIFFWWENQKLYQKVS
jgi:hypothetical protein